MKQSMSYSASGYVLNGKEGYLLSGEFHYFRVPREDWKRRLEMFRDAGGNTVATYVPWCIHEEVEGKISFVSEPQVDFVAFLETVREVGLSVIVRPGPYQYSELIGGGLPQWLLQGYPEILAQKINGEMILNDTVCYLHPLFLEKARTYYRAFAEVVRPFLGDPVTCIQLENELTGIQVWRGSLDYHPALLQLGDEDGRYARFLRECYTTVEALNTAYGTDYAAFSEVRPIKRRDKCDVCAARRNQDYLSFYCSTVREYQEILASWCREDGIDRVPFCHNIGASGMVSLFGKKWAGASFPCLYGVDHYYNLDAKSGVNAPTPQFMFEKFISLEHLRLLGMPPTVFEMQGGNIVDTPPILKEDLYAMYATHLAYGMKGVNYYIYTGGKNYKDTGATADIYDYNAMIHADGTKNETFEAMERFHALIHAHPWLSRTERRTSVNIGFSWDAVFRATSGMGSCAEGQLLDEGSLRSFSRCGVLYTAMTTKYAPALADLDAPLDPSIPLILPTASAMASSAQKAVVRFIEEGGRVLIFGVLPTTDEAYRPCTVLRDYLGVADTVKTETWEQRDNPLISPTFGKVYAMTLLETFPTLPEGCELLCTDQLKGRIAGFRGRYGRGEVTCLAAIWNIRGFDQSAFLEYLLDSMQATPIVASSNRNVFTSLREDKAGHRMLFAMNLYSGAQSTELTVYDREGVLCYTEALRLSPMEVRTINLSDVGE